MTRAASMLTRSLLIRIAGPTLFVSLLFLGSCITAAVYLYHRQSASLQELDENLWSRRVAIDLSRALEDLPVTRPEAEGHLRDHITELLGQARGMADAPRARQLVADLEDAFGRYRARPAADDPDEAARRASNLLEARLIQLSRELEWFNTAEVDRSEATLQRTVAWTAWGLVGVGLAGAIAGVLLGYLVARGLGRSVMRAEELAEVGQIAAGLAHELRNPLTSIKMLVQVDLEKAEARGLPSDDLYAIEQEIRRMEDRLNFFIDFARPARPERRVVDLRGVVDRTLALVGGRARKQRVTLSFDPPSTPAEVEADGEQLRQLLVNLALNALDVMPRGGVLTIEIRPGGDDHVEVLVSDTGPGIPPKNLARLYEPFFTTKETGLGLGLPVSHRIAHDHGGTLRARNRPEGGACFVLRVPTRKAH